MVKVRDEHTTLSVCDHDKSREKSLSVPLWSTKNVHSFQVHIARNALVKIFLFFCVNQSRHITLDRPNLTFRIYSIILVKSMCKLEQFLEKQRRTSRAPCPVSCTYFNCRHAQWSGTLSRFVYDCMAASWNCVFNKLAIFTHYVLSNDWTFAKNKVRIVWSHISALQRTFHCTDIVCIFSALCTWKQLVL